MGNLPDYNSVFADYDDFLQPQPIRMTRVAKPLPDHWLARLVEIAHETSRDDIRRVALALVDRELNPVYRVE